MRVIGQHLDNILLKRTADEIDQPSSFVIDHGADAPLIQLGPSENVGGVVDLDKPVGLTNIGNTCYLNSILQYFFTVDAVRDIVVNFDLYEMEPTEEHVRQRAIGPGGMTVGDALIAHACMFFLQSTCSYES